MVGNGILAFAVMFIVVISVYTSLRLQRERGAIRRPSETCSIQLTKDSVGDSTSLSVNGSLIINKQIKEEPAAIGVGRFVEQSALMIVSNQTETVAVSDLSERGGTYCFEEDIDSIKQLLQK